MSHGSYDYGLEDKILRKNIPGRYSTWSKDEDEEGPRARSDWVDIDGPVPTPAGPPRLERQPRPESPLGPRRETGVKGVLADRQDHLADQAWQRECERKERAAVLHRMANGATRPADDDEAVADQPQRPTWLSPRKGTGRCSGNDGPGNGNGDDGGGDDDDGRGDEDAAELALIRQRRLLELQGTVGLPVFGQVRHVNAFEFLDAVEKEDPRVCVICHVFEDRVPACRRMQAALEALAQRHAAGVKFLRLPATEAPGHADGAFDADTLPVLVAYRAGALVCSLVRCAHLVGNPAAFGPDDVEWLLAEHGLVDARGGGGGAALVGERRATAMQGCHLSVGGGVECGGHGDEDAGFSGSECGSDGGLGVD